MSKVAQGAIANYKINSHLNPSSSRYFGELLEAGVKSVKFHIVKL